MPLALSINHQQSVDSSSKNTCYHCGDICEEVTIQHDEKDFCCEGCKMVYNILNQNQLGNYYELNKNAGTSQKHTGGRNQYEYLDEEEVIAKLIDFTDDEQTRVHFSLPQIHCSSCLWLLENIHLLNDGIIQSRVNFLKREVHISFLKSKLSLRSLVELLNKIGYPPRIQLEDLNEKQGLVRDKTLFYKLGLAGFVFGNIMLLSFPEYLGLNNSGNPELSRYFSYLNFILILPVLAYSGKDYFISAWQGLKQKHLNIDLPVSLGILALFFRSSFEIFTHTGAGYLDSLAGLIFFLLIGKWFQQITYDKISFDRDYQSYFPVACSVVTAGKEEKKTLDQVKKGDLVRIRHGELIPADAILISGKASIDYSFVTGETDPVEKQQGDLLYAGGRQMGGLMEVSIMKKVSNSYLTQLWNDGTFSKKEQSGTTTVLADKVAKIFTATILLIAFGTLLYWLPRNIATAINAFSAVLIVACPCAVALSIPFTFGNAVRILGKKGIYLKNIRVLETLAAVNHVVFDKTGTLTHSKCSQMAYNGTQLSDLEQVKVKSLAMQSIHPMSRQIAGFLQDKMESSVESFKELKGQGVSGIVDGVAIKFGNRQFLGMDDHKNGVPDSKVFVEINGEFKGTFSKNNQYRSGISKVISMIKKWAGISMLSGDNANEKEAIKSLFGSEDALYFNQQPQQKLDYIKCLQNEGAVVAMIGDGLNDAGALSQSDVGISVTEDSAYFSPSCDIIMEASGFDKIPALFSFARASIKLVYFAYFIALLYNIVGLSYAVQGTLSPVIAAILMPASSITILVFGVFTSSFVAWNKKLLNVKIR